MLKKVKKKYEEMSALKKICLWICYLIVMIIIFKLLLLEICLFSNIWQICCGTIWLSLFGIGVQGLFLETILVIIDKLIDKEEEIKKKEIEEWKEKVCQLFQGKEKLEVTLSDFKETVESAILNEIEANNEICLFAKFVDDEIRILIQMKDGTIYPDVIFYTVDQYSVFFEEFYIL